MKYQVNNNSERTNERIYEISTEGPREKKKNKRETEKHS